MNPETPIVEFRNISKRFPGVLAVNNVNLGIRQGSCHGLVGENGAGKSTLGKILAGIYQPDSGDISISGKKIKLHNPIDALHAGIGMVYQELSFCENMSVAENLCLGHIPSKASFVSWKKMRQMARERLSAIKLELDVDRQMKTLPIGIQQMVQIASAVSRGARILIFDEPTSSLSGMESKKLFDLIRLLGKKGVTSLYVSHRLEEIFEICDAISVMRDGSLVDTVPSSGIDTHRLVEMMIGRKLESFIAKNVKLHKGSEALRVENFSSSGKFIDVSFSLHSGEILGFAGLVGSGRTEVSEALFGLDKNARGKIFIQGKEAAIRDPVIAMDLGLGLVPEDRKRHGLVLKMSARDNITLPSLKRLSRLGWIKSREEEKIARHYFDIMKVKATGLSNVAESLSGGNQQKLVIAKWLASHCDILILDEPTRGVDVGAKSEISSLIYELAANGSSVLLISSDLLELVNLATRVIVMREGEIVGSVEGNDIDQHTILKMMTGIRDEKLKKGEIK
jgi:ABC-type sugar transport system ATPase subunit